MCAQLRAYARLAWPALKGHLRAAQPRPQRADVRGLVDLHLAQELVECASVVDVGAQALQVLAYAAADAVKSLQLLLSDGLVAQERGEHAWLLVLHHSTHVLTASQHTAR